MTLQPKARRPRRAGSIDGLDMTKLEVPAPSDESVCIGTIAWVTRDKVSAPTAISMMMMDERFIGPGQHIKKYIIVGNVLTFQRNQAIWAMEGDWIIFIDSDMSWQPDAVKTIVETREKWDLDIVGGLCFQRSEPFQPTLYKKVEGTDDYTYLESWPQDAALEVDATGMAFCLIHKRVFDRIMQQQGGEHFPDFEERQKYVPAPFFRWEFQWGEDFLFCREARSSGNRIFVDTSVKIGHHGEALYDEASFLRELAFRPDDAYEFRDEVLRRMDERATTQDQALSRLGIPKMFIPAPSDGI